MLYIGIQFIPGYFLEMYASFGYKNVQNMWKLSQYALNICSIYMCMQYTHIHVYAIYTYTEWLKIKCLTKHNAISLQLNILRDC